MSLHLAVTPDVLLIDEVADGPTTSALVVCPTGAAGRELSIWERVEPAPWRRVDLARRMGSADTFATPALRSGQVYRVLGSADPRYHPADDTGDDGGEVSEAVVLALRVDPRPAPDLIGGCSVTCGGTWIDVAVEATAAVSLVVELGTAPPTAGPGNVSAFAEGPVDRWIIAEPRRSHCLEVASGLRPGSVLWCLTRVFDAEGQWEEQVDRVALLRRTVAITADAPADGGVGREPLEVRVYRDDQPAGALPLDRDPAGWTVTVGPLDPDVLGVGLRLAGAAPDADDADAGGTTLHVDRFEPEDRYAIPGALPFRMGRTREQMADEPFVVRASRDDEDAGREVRGRYSVRYT